MRWYQQLKLKGIGKLIRPFLLGYSKNMNKLGKSCFSSDSQICRIQQIHFSSEVFWARLHLLETEVLYMFVNNRYAVLVQGNSINSLRIEDELLMIGSGTYGYEGAHGDVIAFDGNRSFDICHWESGI